MQRLQKQEPTPLLLPLQNQGRPVQQTPTEQCAAPPRVVPKRIVSKGRYAALLGRKIGFSTFGLALLFFCLLSALTMVFALVVLRTELNNRADKILFPIVTSLLGVGALYLGHLGRRTIREAKQIETGVPLTRANTADLPAPDSLVRASAEPMQEPQAVLLRAATESVERHEEQLVRASAGGTEQA
jgi:hypothetical protein